MLSGLDVVIVVLLLLAGAVLWRREQTRGWSVALQLIATTLLFLIVFVFD